MRARREPVGEDTGVIRREDTAVIPPLREAPPPAPHRSPPPPGPAPPGRLAVENPWPWLLLVLVAVAALLVWLFLFRGTSDTAAVPRVLGLGQRAAIARLNERGFGVLAVRRASQKPAGRVFAQAPGSGSRLKKGQRVTIDVSSGAAPAAVPARSTRTATTSRTGTGALPAAAIPSLVGKQLVDAAGAVESAGLVADSYPVDASEQAGTVVSQQPGVGTKLPVGRSVRLNVSRGGGPAAAVKIPDVSGDQAADARARLEAARLTVRTTYRRPGKTGVVLEEQPSGGSAPMWTQVTLTIGR